MKKYSLEWWKQNLEDQKKRSVIILIFWFFFFLFVFSSFPKTEVTEKNIQTDYQYQITWQMNQESILIHGYRNKEEELFSLQNQTYFVQNNQLYQFQNDQKILLKNTIFWGYDLLKLRLEFVLNLIEIGNLIYTTQYESGITKKGYSIPIANFVDLYQNQTSTSNETVTVEIVEQDKKILEINLDLHSFMQLNDPNIEIYQIKIQYFDLDSDIKIE